MADDKNAAFNMAMMAGGMYGPNPYSKFPNGIQSTTYAGMPTDAMGNPIQPPPGTTLNTTPAAPPPAPAPAMSQSPGAGYFQTAPGSLALGRQVAPQGSNPGIQALYGRNFAAFAPPAGSPLPPGSMYGGGQAATPPAATPPTGNQGMTYDQVLSMLANPGKVTTPGATVPQSQVTTQPSVLDQFLANQKGGTGAGDYTNTPFFDTLNRLRGGAPA